MTSVRAVTFDELPGDLVPQEATHSPFPTWRYLRRHQPLYHDAANDRWVLTRYVDVAAVLRDAQTYSTRTYEDRFRAVLGHTLAELDGPPHARMRAIAAPSFTGQHVQALEPLLRDAANTLVRSLLNHTEADLVSTVSRHLPAMVIGVLLGLPPTDHPFILRIATTMVNGLEDVEPARGQAMAARAELEHYLAPIVASRRADPSNDLISHIAHAQPNGQPLSLHEVVSYVAFLLAAGGATADTAMANFWWNLLCHPAYLERVRNDPHLMHAAFSESMRRDGPIVYEDRLTTTPVEWYGRSIPANSTIVVSLGSANVDDDVFEAPERFFPERSDLLTSLEHKSGYLRDGVAGHLGFGLGAHFCMGYQLARAEIITATQALLDGLDDLGWAVAPPPEPEVSFFVRTVSALPVRFRVRTPPSLTAGYA